MKFNIIASRLNFRKRVLIIMALSGLIELLILVIAGYFYVVKHQEQDLGQKALGVASFLSRSPNVVDMTESGRASEDEQLRYRNLTKLLGAAFITIGDKKGIRLVHPIDERIGKPMVGGDNYRALIQGESYISIAEGSLGESIRGKSAIYDDNDNVIGVVSVGYLLSNLQQYIKPFLVYLVLVTMVVVVINFAVASYISRRFQKFVLGFEPLQIRQLQAQLETTMETITDGVLVIDDNGLVVSVNPTACIILGVEEAQVTNTLLTEWLPDSDLYTLLETGDTNQVVELILNDHKVIANRSAIKLDGNIVGAVSIFRLKNDDS